MLKIKSEFVNDDWERIYINDRLAFENHSVTARQLMDLLWEQELAEVEYTEVEEED